MKILVYAKDRTAAGPNKINYQMQIVGGDSFNVDIPVLVTLGSSDQQINDQIRSAALAYVNNPANNTGLGTIVENDITVER